MKAFRKAAPSPAAGWAAWPLLFSLALAGCAGGWLDRADAAPLVIDDFAYASASDARKAWNAAASLPVDMAAGGDWGTGRVMVATCDFATRDTRCYWDRSTPLNLSTRVVFELEVYAPNPGAISYLTLYFRSGGGWYGASASLTKPGWQTLRFGRGSFTPEGAPAGWDQIDGIRLSPWKAESVNTWLAFRQLRAVTPAVLLVRDPDSANPELAQQTIDRHLDWLGGFQIDCGVITRAEVLAGLLRECRLAILPCNETVSEAEMIQYESFVAAGGKLLVYYWLPSRMAPLLGVRVTGWTKGDFAAWRFSDPHLPNLPPRVRQASWNITGAVPDAPHARTIAVWENSSGQSTGRAAWLASDHGFFMSHILLGDDPDEKSFALLCLVGSLLPDVWPAAAAGAIDQIGQVGPYLEYAESVAAIRGQGAPTLRAPLVEAELAAAESNRNQAISGQAAGQSAAAITAAHAARARLRQAYRLSLKPVHPELRAFWEHHATGPYPGNWPAAIDALATNQFNAVFVNMLWGGLAHYASAWLPRSSEFNQYGDQIAACVSAAHARGLEAHIWKVNWNLSGAPQSFIDSLRAAGRTQVSSTGQPLDWLCPSHPDNLALETNSLLEVVRNYDVDGIHFDYIRYPDGEHCYCAGCAARFQQQTGRAIAHWPADVLAPGAPRAAFLDWRRAQITRLVEVFYHQSKALKPRVKISAAVWPDAPGAYDGVGQDWRLWVTNGLLDFICPMDYLLTAPAFAATLARQLGYVAGRLPVYPGIGAWQINPDTALAQLQAARAARTGGFVIFELSPDSAANLLPLIGAGATAPDEPDTDEDLLPDRWEIKWFGNLTAAGRATDADGNGLSDYAEYLAGSCPTNAADGLALRVGARDGPLSLSFVARGVDPIGYQNAARHYALESSASLAADAAWAAVPGFADWLAAPGETMLSYTPPASTAAAYYRLRVWLQQKP